MSIIFVHLLNDRSGSPRILSTVISICQKIGLNFDVYAASNGDGWLNGLSIKEYKYIRSNKKIVTLFSYFISQVILFAKLIREDKCRNSVLYINTLLPFGAALYGWLFGRKIIYHLHEVSVNSRILKYFLLAVMRFTANEIICVSNFHVKELKLEGNARVNVISNVVSKDFLIGIKDFEYCSNHNGEFNVVMVSSLRLYKGVDEYVKLARYFVCDDSLKFTLIANASEDEIELYFKGNLLPANIKIFPKTNNVEYFYKAASLVVNLTRIDLCQESFGMTLLEAMAFGIPVIAPPIGGPAEIVKDQITGYLIDSRDINQVACCIKKLQDNADLCREISVAAKTNFSKYGQSEFEKKVIKIFNKYMDVKVA